jgi:hypothetical protein
VDESVQPDSLQFDIAALKSEVRRDAYLISPAPCFHRLIRIDWNGVRILMSHMGLRFSLILIMHI